MKYKAGPSGQIETFRDCDLMEEFNKVEEKPKWTRNPPDRDMFKTGELFVPEYRVELREYPDGRKFWDVTQKYFYRYGGCLADSVWWYERYSFTSECEAMSCYGFLVNLEKEAVAKRKAETPTRTVVYPVAGEEDCCGG